MAPCGCVFSSFTNVSAAVQDCKLETNLTGGSVSHLIDKLTILALILSRFMEFMIKKEQASSISAIIDIYS